MRLEHFQTRPMRAFRPGPRILDCMGWDRCLRVRRKRVLLTTMFFFNSGGVSIAYVDVKPEAGRGDPILLIHGFASNHAVNWLNTLWFKTLTHAGYRVVAFDNRGHGESEKLYRPEDYDSFVMADDARRLLDHLKIE